MVKLSIKKFFLLLKSTSPCLLAIPAFDRIPSSITDTLTLTEYAYANHLQVRLRAVTDLAKK